MKKVKMMTADPNLRYKDFLETIRPSLGFPNAEMADAINSNFP